MRTIYCEQDLDIENLKNVRAYINLDPRSRRLRAEVHSSGSEYGEHFWDIGITEKEEVNNLLRKIQPYAEAILTDPDSDDFSEEQYISSLCEATFK